MARRQYTPLLRGMGPYDFAAPTSSGQGDWRTLARGRRVQPLLLSLGAAEPASAPPVLMPAPAPPPVRLLGLTKVQLVLAVLLLLALVYLAYRLGRGRAPTPIQAVRKMSTNRLSKELYERLEANGRGSGRTRAALAQLGRHR